jgi:serine palmitoyltransferase
MLFPAVHELGFKAGQAWIKLWHNTANLPDIDEAWEFLIAFPGMYRDWWWNLMVNDPLHVAVETVLLLSIIYIMVSRSTQGYKQGKDELNEKERQDLLEDWKQSRAPLAPPADEEDEKEDGLIVHKQDGKILTVSTLTKPDTKLEVLNFCNFDFLGFQTSSILQEASKEALMKYGCGSCGPRGFYGTIDKHLELEDSISKFVKTDGAIMYSDGASTCSSTVAAFAKRGDILVVDEGIYEPLMTGVYLSRANVHWFKHNDMDDLERVLDGLHKTDQRLGRKPNALRRFIVVEGLYKNLGTIAPLDKIVELKNKYNYRLILDESFSFGTLGKTGRGALEHFNKRHMYDAEIVTIALENSVGSIGGVTVGNEEVVDHQRLSGAGYCFSASAPPFTASAAIAAINHMESNVECIQNLHANIEFMYHHVEKTLTHLVVTSDERSPIIVLQLPKESEYEAEIMRGIMHECLQRGVAIVATGQDACGNLRTELAPAIRMTVSALHNQEDMEKAVNVLQESSKSITSKYPLYAA